MLVNKNQLAGQRGDQRLALYQGEESCLPRYNYSTGAGWKTKCKKHRQLDFSIKEKKRMFRP